MQNKRKTSNHSTRQKSLLLSDRQARQPGTDTSKKKKATAILEDNPLQFGIRRSTTNPVMAHIRFQIRTGGISTGWSNVGILVRFTDFDSKSVSIIGDPERTALLRNLRERALQVYMAARLSGRVVTAEEILAALSDEDRIAEKTYTLERLIDSWLSNNQLRFDTGDITLRTLWKNKRWTNDFWAYCLTKYGKEAPITEIRPADAKTFVLWLRKERNLSNNVAQSTASHARTILDYALDNDWITRNPFANFRRKMDTVERVTLTEAEMRQFCTFPLESKALERVRDTFFFMILSGLSYADVERLTAENRKATAEGAPYIEIRRRKMLSRTNSTPAIIPLSPMALVLLDKYAPTDAKGALLPMFRNAPFNRSLKQIAAMAGLEKSVSTKVARNSLATYLLNEGVPLPSISAMMGHSSTVTTQKFYAKVSPEKVIRDMECVPLFHLHSSERSTNE